MENRKRRTPRINSQLPVRWIRQQAIVEAVATDINAHGLFILTDKPIAAGMLMEIEVELPDGPLKMFVVSRYVGATLWGRGIGAAIFVIDPIDAQRWSSHYYALLAHPAASNSPAESVKKVAVTDLPAAEIPRALAASKVA